MTAKRPRHRTRLAALAGGALLLQMAGCAAPPAASEPPATPHAAEPPAIAPPAADPVQTPPPAAAPTEAPPAAPSLHAGQLSAHDRANDADLAIAPDGTRHAIYRAPHAKSGRQALYHRASADGGARWSEPLLLTEASSPLDVGNLRLAIDGEGRVYACWKDVQGYSAQPSGNGYGGTLTYRVLEGTTWSAPRTAGRSQAVTSWFTSVDPKGRMHLVWAEARGTLGPGGADRLMRLAPTADSTAEPETVLAQAVDAHDTAPALDGYDGLRGYVDAEGRVHYLVLKAPAAGGPQLIMHGVGSTMKEVAKVQQFTFWTTLTDNPPQLLVDAAGQDHMLIVDENGDWIKVFDYRLGAAGEPTLLAQSALGGRLKALVGVQGPRGQMAALMTIQATDKPEDAFDLYVSTHQDGAWTLPVDATINDGQQAPGQAAYQVGGDFQAGAAAAAFRGDGKLDVVYVNAARETSGDKPAVYFKQLP